MIQKYPTIYEATKLSKWEKKVSRGSCSLDLYKDAFLCYEGIFVTCVALDKLGSSNETDLSLRVHGRHVCNAITHSPARSHCAERSI